jgi:hypothetical protein
MARLLPGLVLAACLVAPAPALARKRYTITVGTAGVLAVVGNEVVVTKDFEKEGEVHDLWYFEKVWEEQGAVPKYIRLSADDRYLTGNEKGEVYLTDKPEKGSEWGVDIPGRAAEETRISTLRGRYLWVGDKLETLKDAKGKERKVRRLRLLPRAEKGPPAVRPTRFTITLIAP